MKYSRTQMIVQGVVSETLPAFWGMRIEASSNQHRQTEKLRKTERRDREERRDGEERRRGEMENLNGEGPGIRIGSHEGEKR